MNLLSHTRNRFSEIVLCDTEYARPEGGLPEVICVVYHLVKSGRTLRFWADELVQGTPPLSVGTEDVFVCYNAAAELMVYLTQRWNLPEHVLDLFPVHREEVMCFRGKGAHDVRPTGLVDAYRYHTGQELDSVHKKQMQQRCIEGFPFSQAEKRAILEYCEDDVMCMVPILEDMACEDAKELMKFLHWGDYMKSVAFMEFNGIPMDVEAVQSIQANKERIIDLAMDNINAEYGVYDAYGTFRYARLEQFLRQQGIAWSRTPSGRLNLADDYFKEQRDQHPFLANLYDARKTIGLLNKTTIPLGPDGRVRTFLNPFRSQTSRNQPSNASFPFGMPKWSRFMIRPPEGHALVTIDYSQQEVLIAAALSRDVNYVKAYYEPDFYMYLAKEMDPSLSSDATKQSHPDVRNKYKIMALGIQYGMGPDALSRKVDTVNYAGHMFMLDHQRLFDRYWRWQQKYWDLALSRSYLSTKLGWKCHFEWHEDIRFYNQRSILNFPVQGCGADILRVACVYLMRAGIEICAPIHDAIAFNVRDDMYLMDAIRQADYLMKRASEDILGFPLKTEIKLVQHPNFYVESEGKNFWKQLRELKNLQHVDQVCEEKYVQNEFIFSLEESGFSDIDLSQLTEYKVVYDN